MTVRVKARYSSALFCQFLTMPATQSRLGWQGNPQVGAGTTAIAEGVGGLLAVALANESRRGIGSPHLRPLRPGPMDSLGFVNRTHPLF